MRWLILISFLFLGTTQDYEYKRGRPTTKGIDAYVEANWLPFIADYQKFIGDTLFFEPFISTDNLSKYYDYTDGDAGYFERPDNIIITNEEKYIDYEVKLLSRYERNGYQEASMFVRAVVMHELTHCYVYQIMMMAQHDKKLAYEFRQGLRIIPVDHYGTNFLEEGICEYVVEIMGEMIVSDEVIVITKTDLQQHRNSHEVKYRYSRQFVTPIVQEFGLEPAIYMILSNKPPNDVEILNPKLYYDRLKWN